MDVSYHMEQEYIWFRGGDQNDFWDIRSLWSEVKWSERVEHNSTQPTPLPTPTPGMANLDPRAMIDMIYVGDY